MGLEYKIKSTEVSLHVGVVISDVVLTNRAPTGNLLALTRSKAFWGNISSHVDASLSSAGVLVLMGASKRWFFEVFWGTNAHSMCSMFSLDLEQNGFEFLQIWEDNIS